MPALTQELKATCDVPGCGLSAEGVTDGSETDVQGLGRKAIAKLFYCARHANWPHSEDAQAFVKDPKNQFTKRG